MENNMRSSILAGVILSLAACSSLYLPNKLESASVFSFGLILICILNARLFTGSILDIEQGLNKNKIKYLIQIWIGNLIGALSVCVLLKICNIAPPISSNILNSKLFASWEILFCKAILCNFLVCMTVHINRLMYNWLNKIIGIALPIILFVIVGYEHCVANMFILGNILDSTTFIFISRNLILTTLGNILGGILFINLKE